MLNHNTKEALVDRFPRIIVPRVVPILLLLILFTHRKVAPYYLIQGFSIKASSDNDRRPVERNVYRQTKILSCMLI